MQRLIPRDDITFNSSITLSLSSHCHAFAGVYLSYHDGIVLEPNSSILITDTGTTSPQQLVCTSDRKPCCLDQPHRYGEWYFPDGSQVKHISQTPVPTSYHRNRDNGGNVNLYRVSNSVLSPTGRFCCEIEDATATNQTLCVNFSESHHNIFTV